MQVRICKDELLTVVAFRWIQRKYQLHAKHIGYEYNFCYAAAFPLILWCVVVAHFKLDALV